MKVSCRNCKHFKVLYDSLGSFIIPEPCMSCFPFEMDEYIPFYIRKEYEELN